MHWPVAESQPLTVLSSGSDVSRLPSCDQEVEETVTMPLEDCQYELKSFSTSGSFNPIKSICMIA